MLSVRFWLPGVFIQVTSWRWSYLYKHTCPHKQPISLVLWLRPETRLWSYTKLEWAARPSPTAGRNIKYLPVSLVWTSGVTSWRFSDDENTRNQPRATQQWSQGSWDNTQLEQLVTRRGRTASKVPAHVVWPWGSSRGGQAAHVDRRPPSRSLASSQLAVFGGGFCLWLQKHSPHCQTWKHDASGCFSAKRRMDEALYRQNPQAGQTGHGGTSSIAVIQNTRPGNKGLAEEEAY